MIKILEALTALVSQFFTDYGVIGIFLGTVLEEIIAPIPSTIVILGGSYFMMGALPITFDSVLKLILEIAIPVGLGMTIGSSVIYGLCYYLGKPFVVRYGKYFGLKWDEIENFSERINNQKRDYILIYVARATPIIPSVVISGFCGVVRYDAFKYLVLTFIGGVTRAIILGFIGWQFGVYTDAITARMDILENLVIIIVVIAIIYYIYTKKFKK